MMMTFSEYRYQKLGLSPDIVTTAKSIGNGIPVGAFSTPALYFLPIDINIQHNSMLDINIEKTSFVIEKSHDFLI